MSIRKSVVWLLVILASCRSTERKIDTTYTLNRTDHRPFGAAVFHRILSTLYKPGQPTIVKKPFDEYIKDRSEETIEDELYVIVSPRVMFWQKEAEALQDYILKGNTVLLATDEISEDLASTFNIRLHQNEQLFSTTDQYGDTYLVGPDSLADRYSYYYHPLQNSLTSGEGIDTTAIPIHLSNGHGAVFVFSYGNGRLIVVNNARSLSNYFLLNHHNIQYLKHIFAFLPNPTSHLLVDEFAYQHLNREKSGLGLLSVLFRFPPLRWAFWILVTAGILWVITNMRRRQRMIPAWKKNENTSVAFMQTIARLYFNQHNNTDLVSKMQIQFFDRLHRQFFVAANLSEQQLLVAINAKTQLSHAEAYQLLSLFNAASSLQAISDEQLIQVSQLIKKSGV